MKVEPMIGFIFFIFLFILYRVETMEELAKYIALLLTIFVFSYESKSSIKAINNNNIDNDQ